MNASPFTRMNGCANGNSEFWTDSRRSASGNTIPTRQKPVHDWESSITGRQVVKAGVMSFCDYEVCSTP
jgi:hypothetical protein